ncbi:MAG: type II toxin-antitoxin system RelE/ParE family toxin [Bacteroidales bacterium]|jgi:plasmid stabilization system protein ParE|nr:type II toxin-antitoxin system RelE/ParE family toxin [Bacteroidales bacterium]
MYKLIIKPFAELDVADAFAWYSDKREGLGDEFLLALDAIFNTIQKNPFHFQVVFKNVRRALAARFPYGIFFIIEGSTVYVLAVLHVSRDPKTWKDRQ